MRNSTLLHQTLFMDHREFKFNYYNNRTGNLCARQCSLHGRNIFLFIGDQIQCHAIVKLIICRLALIFTSTSSYECAKMRWQFQVISKEPPMLHAHFLCWFNRNASTVAPSIRLRTHAEEIVLCTSTSRRLSSLFEFYWTCQGRRYIWSFRSNVRWLVAFPTTHK